MSRGAAGGGLLTLDAFEEAQHRSITRAVLSEVQAAIAGRMRHFTEASIKEIADANIATDSILAKSAAYWHSERHFTNEAFPESTDNLKTLKDQILEALRNPNRPGRGNNAGSQARRYLGSALHAIQDFYSHSNWVELGNTAIETSFGRSTLAKPDQTLKACPANPNVLGPNGGGGLTSGYYVTVTGCGPLPYPGKCYHGNNSASCSGISKDPTTKPGHSDALEVARKATKDFVEQITTALQGNDKALGALLGQSSIAFAIDTTDSMTGAIEEVKSQVAEIVARTQINPDTAPTEWVLVPFNDPSVGPTFVTDSPSELLAAVQGLVVEGGGDCPEPSQSALCAACIPRCPTPTSFCSRTRRRATARSAVRPSARPRRETPRSPMS